MTGQRARVILPLSWLDTKLVIVHLLSFLFFPYILLATLSQKPRSPSSTDVRMATQGGVLAVRTRGHSPRPTSFIDLPVEIRNIIYSHAYALRDWGHRRNLSISLRPSQQRLFHRTAGAITDRYIDVVTTMMKVCHLTRNDLVPRFCSYFIFTFFQLEEAFEAFQMFASKLTNTTKSHIRMVNIYMPRTVQDLPQTLEQAFNGFTALQWLTLHGPDDVFGTLIPERFRYDNKLHNMQSVKALQRARPQLSYSYPRTGEYKARWHRVFDCATRPVLKLKLGSSGLDPDQEVGYDLGDREFVFTRTGI